MASGTFIGSTGNRFISAKIVWSSTSDTLTNKSVVSASLYYMKSSDADVGTTGAGSFSLTINGNTSTTSKYVNLSCDDTWVYFMSHEVTVDHDADGTKSISIYADGGIPKRTFSYTNCSGTAILDNIPRASTASWSGTPVIGTAFTIALNPADAGFTHSLSYTWQGVTTALATGVASSYTWTPPMSLCNAIPNATAGTLTINVDTYISGTTLLGSTATSGQITVPASVIPTISSVVLSDTSDVPSAWNVWVKGISVLHVKATAAGAYSSTIAGYSITANGVNTKVNDSDVCIIDTTSQITVTTVVTDSRGRTATDTKTLTAVDYSPPVIQPWTMVRANNQGTPVDNGTYAKIPLKASGSAVSNKNTVTVKVYHMRSDLTAWTLARTLSGAYSYDQTVMIGNMETARSYSYKIEITDQFNTTTSLGVLEAEGAVIGWLSGGNGISFGKTAEISNTLDCKWDIKARDDITCDGNVEADSYTIGGDHLLRVVDVAQAWIGGDYDHQLGVSDSNVTVEFANVRTMANKVTLKSDENGLKIPSGVTHIMVSAQVYLTGGTAGLRRIVLRKGADVVCTDQRHLASTETPEVFAISGMMIPVSANDVITMAVYGNEDDVIDRNESRTRITVTAYS